MSKHRLREIDQMVRGEARIGHIPEEAREALMDLCAEVRYLQSCMTAKIAEIDRLRTMLRLSQSQQSEMANG